MDSISNDENTDAILLIYAENAFNWLIEKDLLYTVLKLYELVLPHLFQVVFPVPLDHLLLEVVN